MESLKLLASTGRLKDHTGRKCRSGKCKSR